MEHSKALDSYYLNYQLNEEIPLHSGRAVLTIQERKVELAVSLFLQWLPKPAVRFSGKVLNSEINLFSANNALFGTAQKMTLSKDINCEVLIYSSVFGGQHAIEGIVKNYSSSEHKKVDYVEFSVVNFLNCLGRYIETDQWVILVDWCFIIKNGK